MSNQHGDLSLPHDPSRQGQEAYELRHQLGAFMKSRRVAHEGAFTQLGLSRALGFSYSVVTNWENGTRSVLASHLTAWASQLGVDPKDLAQFATAVLPDEKAGIATGSRMDAEVNARLKELRKLLRLSLRDMADRTGISTGHLQRIESNQSNLSVAQVRNIHRNLKVNYAWLIEGEGEWNAASVEDELERLRRNIELLESFRQQTSQALSVSYLVCPPDQNNQTEKD
jgi:transcriptional regulator with XRE-family HTH domain